MSAPFPTDDAVRQYFEANVDNWIVHPRISGAYTAKDKIKGRVSIILSTDDTSHPEVLAMKQSIEGDQIPVVLEYIPGRCRLETLDYGTKMTTGASYQSVGSTLSVNSKNFLSSSGHGLDPKNPIAVKIDGKEIGVIAVGDLLSNDTIDGSFTTLIEGAPLSSPSVNGKKINSTPSDAKVGASSCFVGAATGLISGTVSSVDWSGILYDGTVCKKFVMVDNDKASQVGNSGSSYFQLSDSDGLYHYTAIHRGSYEKGVARTVGCPINRVLNNFFGASAVTLIFSS